MIIDMPHTPEELAESFAKRDIEVDITDIQHDDAEIIAAFLMRHGFKAIYHPEDDLADLITGWGREYGILVSDGARDVGANSPDRHFGIVRFAVEDVMEIIAKDRNALAQTISDEDFESVF